MNIVGIPRLPRRRFRGHHARRQLFAVMEANRSRRIKLPDARMTYRSDSGYLWTRHQMLLTGSVFAAVRDEERAPLAQALMEDARHSGSPRCVGLLLTGLFVPPARTLWAAGRRGEQLRTLVHLVRHPDWWRRYRRLLNEADTEWRFLRQGWVADRLATFSSGA